MRGRFSSTRWGPRANTAFRGVLQTKEATAVLEEGQLITVDGNRGLVLRPE